MVSGSKTSVRNSTAPPIPAAHQFGPAFGQRECQVHAGGLGVHRHRRDLQITKGQPGGGPVPRRSSARPTPPAPAGDGSGCGWVEPLHEHFEGYVLVLVGGQAALRTWASTSAAVGSPPRSTRSTRVLTKNPTKSSSAGSPRPATGNPSATSVLALSLASNTAKAACTTMKLVALCSAATAAHPLLQLRRPLQRLTWPRADRPPADRAGRWATAAARATRPALAPSRPAARRCGCGRRPDHRTARAATTCNRRTAPATAPIRGLPAAPAGIGDPHITRQRGHRPAVGGDMVHHGHQHVFVGGEAEKCCPQRDFGCEIEGMRTAASSTASPQSGGRPAAGINDLPTHIGPLGRDHQLLRNPSGAGEHCAQALMARHHIAERRPQRLDIEEPAQPQRHRDVVDRGGPLQLVQEPQPALGERQRHHRRALDRPPTALRRPPSSPIRGANWATVGASNTARTERSASRPALTAAISRIADSESPPRSKNESSTPTRSTPSTWA